MRAHARYAFRRILDWSNRGPPQRLCQTCPIVTTILMTSVEDGSVYSVSIDSHAVLSAVCLQRLSNSFEIETSRAGPMWSYNETVMTRNLAVTSCLVCHGTLLGCFASQSPKFQGSCSSTISQKHELFCKITDG